MLTGISSRVSGRLACGVAPVDPKGERAPAAGGVAATRGDTVPDGAMACLSYTYFGLTVVRFWIDGSYTDRSATMHGWLAV